MAYYKGKCSMIETSTCVHLDQNDAGYLASSNIVTWHTIYIHIKSWNTKHPNYSVRRCATVYDIRPSVTLIKHS